MASKAVVAGSPSTAPAEMTENIAYMTLMHELKAAFPNLSDEAVKQCVLEVSQNLLWRCPLKPQYQISALALPPML